VNAMHERHGALPPKIADNPGDEKGGHSPFLPRCSWPQSPRDSNRAVRAMRSPAMAARRAIDPNANIFGQAQCFAGKRAGVRLFCEDAHLSGEQSLGPSTIAPDLHAGAGVFPSAIILRSRASPDFKPRITLEQLSVNQATALASARTSSMRRTLRDFLRCRREGGREWGVNGAPSTPLLRQTVGRRS